MSQVLEKSKETSLRRYEAIPYDAETGQGPFGWFNMLIRQSAGKFSKEQFSVFRAIHQWRDELARKEDESPLFVMNNATVFDIARRLPPDPKALHGLLDTGSYLAKRDVSKLFGIITKAIAQGANGPSVAEVIRGNAPATMGIGEVARVVLPRLRDRAKDGLDTKDLVSYSSQLWGNVAMSSRWDSQNQTSTPKLIEFELPWAQFVQSAKLADDTSQGSVPIVTLSEKMAMEQSTPNEVSNGDLIPEDSEFTLKTGMKRKAPEPESSSESDADTEVEPDTLEPTGPEPESSGTGDEEIAITFGEEKKKARKARKAEKKALKQARREEERIERKDRKKAEKQAKKTKRTDTPSKGAQDEGDEPFDYSKANSVLKSDRSAANGTGPPRKARFEPYALNKEGPKPARRMHGEKLGKSATFKK
jgi:exosome complex exonuclease RRP6